MLRDKLKLHISILPTRSAVFPSFIEISSRCQLLFARLKAAELTLGHVLTRHMQLIRGALN
ncbi:MAG: hypothetical protein CMQ17_02475 [Gammaproteobacteria bacterium]|nr:hypothetical protein [Gammaproteobacteria bacterium]